MLWMHPRLFSTAFLILKKMIHSDTLQLQQMMTCLSIVLAKGVGYAFLLFWQGWNKWLNSWFESTQTIIRAAGIKITRKAPASSWKQYHILSKQRARFFSVFCFQWWSAVIPWSKIPLWCNGFDTIKRLRMETRHRQFEMKF